MSKSRDAFRTISEVSTTLDTPAHVLRFWESKFNQVKPVKRAGGRRYYRPADMNLLAGIKGLLHDDGMTIKGAQKLLREKGVKHVAKLGEERLLDQQGPLETDIEGTAEQITPTEGSTPEVELTPETHSPTGVTETVAPEGTATPKSTALDDGGETDATNIVNLPPQDEPQKATGPKLTFTQKELRHAPAQ